MSNRSYVFLLAAFGVLAMAGLCWVLFNPPVNSLPSVATNDALMPVGANRDLTPATPQTGMTSAAAQELQTLSQSPNPAAMQEYQEKIEAGQKGDPLRPVPASPSQAPRTEP